MEPPRQSDERLGPELPAGVAAPPAEAPLADVLPELRWRRPIAVGFLSIAGLVLLLMVLIYRPLLRPLLWAASLATLVYPVHQRVLRLVGGRATLAAVLSTALWLAVLIVPSIFVVSQLVNEARDLWPRLYGQLGDETFQQLATWVESTPLRRFVHVAFDVPGGGGAEALEVRLKTVADALTEFIVQHLRSLTLGAPGAMVRVGLTVVIFFFFLRQGPGWGRRLREALPLQPAHADELVETVTRSINAVFRGVLLTAATQSVLGFVGYTVAGAPVPVILASLTFLASLLPFVGAAGVWLPTAIGLYLSGDLRAAIGLSIYGTLVVSLVDNFLRPFFIGRDMHLPLLWLFLSIIGGLQAFGFLGVVLGPAALALFLACYRIYMQERRKAALQPARPAA
jgi:predicted PurR-regulated permease PerM